MSFILFVGYDCMWDMLVNLLKRNHCSSSYSFGMHINIFFLELTRFILCLHSIGEQSKKRSRRVVIIFYDDILT